MKKIKIKKYCVCAYVIKLACSLILLVDNSIYFTDSVYFETLIKCPIPSIIH